MILSKGLSKLYAEPRRGAKQSDIQPGDQVLVKRAPHEMQNKLDTPYLPEPHHVVSRDGSLWNRRRVFNMNAIQPT